MGVFSIIEKDRYHSNLYSNAPMPTCSASPGREWRCTKALPGYPASHGCIRMSQDFAKKLWPVTDLGVRVIVTRSELASCRLCAPQAVRSEAQARAAGRDQCTHRRARPHAADGDGAGDDGGCR